MVRYSVAMYGMERYAIVRMECRKLRCRETILSLDRILETIVSSHHNNNLIIINNNITFTWAPFQYSFLMPFTLPPCSIVLLVCVLYSNGWRLDRSKWT